jgi:DNA-binding LytR/AlgR family response regulator
VNIIIFDDDFRIVQKSESVVKKAVQSAGIQSCDILAYSNVEEFKKRIGEAGVDIAILDISVPEDENFGISCAMEIRKKNKNAHIIFVTSNDGMIHQIFSGMIRPTHFILKDSGWNELEEVLAEILKESGNDRTIKVAYGRTEYFLLTEEIVTICKCGRIFVSVSPRPGMNL